MSVPIGTTPTFTLTFSEDIDLTQAVNVYVTFQSGMETLTKTGDALQVEPHSIGVLLSQEDTLSFLAGSVSIQANWITADDKRIASEVVSYKFDKQLLMQVIE